MSTNVIHLGEYFHYFQLPQQVQQPLPKQLLNVEK